jgi:hypothetical protein
MDSFDGSASDDADAASATAVFNKVSDPPLQRLNTVLILCICSSALAHL